MDAPSDDDRIETYRRDGPFDGLWLPLARLEFNDVLDSHTRMGTLGLYST